MTSPVRTFERVTRTLYLILFLTKSKVTDDPATPRRDAIALETESPLTSTPSTLVNLSSTCTLAFAAGDFGSTLDTSSNPDSDFRSQIPTPLYWPSSE